MLIYREYAAKVVVMAVGVLSAAGKKPFISLREEVEKQWKKVQEKFNLKPMSRKERFQQRIQQRTLSDNNLLKMRKEMNVERRPSDVGEKLAKFKKMDAETVAAEIDDVYHPNWKPPKFDKNAPDYGRPKPGSLTEKRGIAAGHHIGKEIITLVEMISEYGVANKQGQIMITFGELFSIYQYISDKVVGMLMRARKHKLLTFEGEMLFQRQDDHKIITLLRPLKEVRAMYAQSDDPAKCLTNV